MRTAPHHVQSLRSGSLCRHPQSCGLIIERFTPEVNRIHGIHALLDPEAPVLWTRADRLSHGRRRRQVLPYAPSADEEANRALRFTISRRAGLTADVGPIAVWLSGSGAGYVTGQIFPVDGGLSQHL